MDIELHPGNAVEWAREYSGEPFHALLCDPPYHLTNRVVDWGGFKDPAQGGRGKPQLTRNSERGFMGKQWDGGDVAFDPATWEAFASVMYPGAFGMAFASSRGWHRLAVAIEDAGFVIHPSLFGWTYGSGFPKATRLNHGHPKTEVFAGHRYGLQALKPALEPIIVFQKPYQGRPVDCITATGAGCLAIDAARIPAENKTPFPVGTQKTGYSGDFPINGDDPNPNGRWPANFLLLDAEAARRLDEQSGTLNSGGPSRNPDKYERASDNTPGWGNIGTAGAIRGYPGEGGASRFFFRVQEQLDDADPVHYVAKASRRERDAGLDAFPLKEKFTMDVGEGVMNRESKQWDEVTARNVSHARNPHPTVKPLALARYLATLLLPPAEYAPRRLFVPFAGVASECIGAMQAGWEQVVGVELTDEYIPIAQARVEYWQKRGVQMEL